MTEHSWSGSGTGLGRRYDCSGCGCQVFSYEEPLVSGMEGDNVLLAKTNQTPTRWSVTSRSPDCDEELVRDVMAS